MNRLLPTVATPTNNTPPVFADWLPRHLPAADQDALYQQALAQLEVAVANAWLNLLTTPESQSRLAAYEETRAAVARLEADWDRLKALRPREG